MDWNGLKTFLAIVETGSLAGAARKLGVNHSTVYRRLQALESVIEARLLEVQGNQYQITPIGEELAALGDSIAHRFSDIERLLIGKELQPRGHVRITAPFNLAYHYIPDALTSFRQQYPEITIEVLSTNQEINMNSRIADIAVRATPNPPEHLIGRKVASLPWSIYASPTYLESAPELSSLADLSAHNLIGGSGSMLNLPAFSWLEQHHPERITTRCDELTAMSYFAESGHGIALLPADQQRPGIVKCCKFDPAPASDIWLLTHPDLRKTARIRLVMNCLKQYFEEIGDSPTP